MKGICVDKKHKRIVIVDDNSPMRKTMLSILKSFAIPTTARIDGFDAIKDLLEEDVCLFVVDIDMPRLDGMKFVTLLRMTEAHKETPVIFVTSRQGMRERAYANFLNANYMTKPYDNDEITALIKEVLKI